MENVVLPDEDIWQFVWIVLLYDREEGEQLACGLLKLYNKVDVGIYAGIL
jgi:hypothetical protein